MRGRNSVEQAASVGIRFSQMVNLREYDGELAAETVRSTKQQPIYRVLNFRTDENDLVVDSSTTSSDLKTNKPVKKVQLESFKITRHHLNGCIKAKSMSLDQQCYIRITIRVLIEVFIFLSFSCNYRFFIQSFLYNLFLCGGAMGFDQKVFKIMKICILRYVFFLVWVDPLSFFHTFLFFSWFLVFTV